MVAGRGGEVKAKHEEGSVEDKEMEEDCSSGRTEKLYD